MFSIYTSAFLLNKNKFPFEESLLNFSKFADEVVVAVNQPLKKFIPNLPSQDAEDDKSYELLEKFLKDNNLTNVKLIKTSLQYDDIEMDGKIKNAALQATTQEVKIQMDLDEIIPLSMKPKWIEFAKILLKDPRFDCFMVPTIDLFGARNKIRSEVQTGLKFRMHKGGFFRGVWKEARWGEKIDTSKSDTCELIDANGNLARCSGIVQQALLSPFLTGELTKYIYTVHLGYLSFDHRININKSIWAEHWKLRSGHEENVPVHKIELESVRTIFHTLPLE